MGIYEQLGIKPIINASGAVTRLGGAPMSGAVLEAFCQAANASVPIDQLQAVACKRIAAATGTEAGLVTTGAAAALTLGAAAILARHDVGRMERLPNCEGFPNEFVIAREHRNGYDHAVRATGAKLVEVGFHELVAGAGVRRVEAAEYETAFGPQTAGVLYVFSSDAHPPLADVVRRAHAHQLPVLVDAAGELPPRANLRAIAGAGADLVAFSGGKAIRGPQSTGILCGRREFISSAALQMLDMDDHPQLWEPPAELIDRARLSAMPRHGIGRSLKVSKEQIVALLVALDAFARGERDRLLTGYRRCLETVAAALAECPARCHLREGDGECLPILEIAVDENKLGRTAMDVCRRLRAGSPPCYVGHAGLGEGKLIINPMHLDENNAAELARRIVEELRPPG
ncbi:MAG: aminotransferase class V-fold PLP-dependent enzyme [Pirellulales bacterium]